MSLPVKRTVPAEPPAKGKLIAVILGTVLLVAVARRGGLSGNGYSATPIPRDVAVEVLREQTLHHFWRSLAIRLNRKVSEDELAVIARELRSRDPKEYDRTKICYYLPGMEVGAGAWASSHFDPDLEVRILGLPADLSVFTNEAVPEGSTRVAMWADEVGGYVLTLLQSGNGLAMRRRFNDMSVDVEELIESRAGNGRRLDSREGSDFGEYYVIAESGALELWDEDGLFRTAFPIDAE